MVLADVKRIAIKLWTTKLSNKMLVAITVNLKGILFAMLRGAFWITLRAPFHSFNPVDFDPVLNNPAYKL